MTTALRGSGIGSAQLRFDRIGSRYDPSTYCSRAWSRSRCERHGWLDRYLLMLRRLTRLGVATVMAAAAFVLPQSAQPAAAAAPCTIGITLRQGTRAAEVWCLETTLRLRGYSGVVGPNPFFGATTTVAVQAFQQSAGLVADGIVGPQTAAALGIRRSVGTPVPPNVVEQRVIGTSVQGRDIVAYRMGTPGGRVVLVVGVIHGDENKGALVAAELRTMPTPAGIDLWIVDSVNPDGQAMNTRQNANGVDLNRNFESGWSYIARGAHGQYSGEQPADQPESQAIENFIRLVQPSIGIWYHQDAHVITTSGRRKAIPLRYSTLVGLGTGGVPCTQMCTGTATKFANTAVPQATNFLVELPGSDQVTPEMMLMHARAVLDVITM